MLCTNSSALTHIIENMKMSAPVYMFNCGFPSDEWNRKTSKKKKKCGAIEDNSSDTKRLRDLKVEMASAEVVQLIFPKKDGVDLGEYVNGNTLADLSIAKPQFRALLLSPGSMQIKQLKFGTKNLLPFVNKGPSNLTAPLYELRGLHVGGDIMIIAYREAEDEQSQPNQWMVAAKEPIKYTICSTPRLESSVMRPLALALAAAYASFPPWSIPVSISGTSEMPVIGKDQFEQWMGSDGGFSSSVYAFLVGCHVQQKLKMKYNRQEMYYAIKMALNKQNAAAIILPATSRPSAIDVTDLAKQITPSAQSDPNFSEWCCQFAEPLEIVGWVNSSSAGNLLNQPIWYIIAFLNALPFNLVFRKLRMCDLIDYKSVHLRNTIRDLLSRVLLYNVSLREVDFSGSDLNGYGRMLGGAVSVSFIAIRVDRSKQSSNFALLAAGVHGHNKWQMSMNGRPLRGFYLCCTIAIDLSCRSAQPLLSRVNFSSCNLSRDDMQGLSQGLTRIWCGGTALAESISFAGNKSIPSDTFDEFFLALVDPSSQAWPGEAPPPPNLAYLQELDMRNTCALGPGFVAFAHRTVGLRTLRVSAVGDEECIGDVLRALASVNAPLETFHGTGFGTNIIQSIFLFFYSLREVNLGGFVGDASLLLNGWPQPVPKLALSIGDGSSATGGWVAPSLTGHSPGSLELTSDEGFGISALETLRWTAPGLKKLVLRKMGFWQLDGIAQLLSMCGLETLHVTLPVAAGCSSPRISEVFFASLAQSRTLKDLQLPGQLITSDVPSACRPVPTDQ